jgi:hypothetical protein
LLSALRKVTELWLKEQCAYHRELINSRLPDPKINSVGDIVFAQRAVRSDAARGQVDKLTYPFTGPWHIVAKLHGALYKLEHCSAKKREKKHASDLSPNPAKLILFQPLDGTNNQYGQLYWKIKEHPYMEAGIKGFTPPTPVAVPIQFLWAREDLSFKWPTLAELNNELFPDLSRPDMDKILKLDNSVVLIPGFHTGPNPSAPSCSVPMPPPANLLAQHIINIADKLFFISCKIAGSSEDIRKWRLVHIALATTMQTYPSCLNNGRYAVDFYNSHPSNFKYNAINQRFWLQYYSTDDLSGPCSSSNTHLICPSDTSKAYAKRHKLHLFHRFLNLTHTDLYIHGPFNFATVNGRKSRDCICNANWDILWSNTNMFHNLLPPSAVPTYSVHIDYCTYTTFHGTRYLRNVCSLPQP